jgi:hypothetical protein
VPFSSIPPHPWNTTFMLCHCAKGTLQEWETRVALIVYGPLSRSLNVSSIL